MADLRTQLGSRQCVGAANSPRQFSLGVRAVQFVVCGAPRINRGWKTTGVTMAESKGSLLAKSVQKHAGRAKEKVSARIIPNSAARPSYGYF